MAKKALFAVLYPGNDWATKNTALKGGHRKAYESFFDIAREEYGFRGIRMSTQWYNGESFERAWEWKGGTWTKIRGRFKPDLIIDKASLRYDDMELKMSINQNFLVVNPWELDVLTSDKIITNTAYSEISPQTFLVRPGTDIAPLLKQIKSKEVILKPRLGHGGTGIRVLSKAQAKKAKVTEPTVLQPVIDTSRGIPGLYKGIHDFRIVVAGNKPITAYIRTPAPGTKLCNISQGGGVIFVPLSKIPKEIKPALKHIIKSLEAFEHKVFACDFFFDGKKPLLVEMNAKPIMYFPEGFKKEQDKMQRKMLDYYSSIL